MYTIIHNKIDTPKEEIFDTLEAICAFKEGYCLEDIKKLFSNGVDINITNKRGSTPLIKILQDNRIPLDIRIEVTKYLIEAGADVHKTDRNSGTALHYAMGNHCTALTQLIIDAGAKLNVANIYGRTPLMEAVYYKDKTNVVFLIGLGADINTISTDGDTNIYIATDTNNIEMLKILLDSGADLGIFSRPDDITRRPFQPLHYAIIHKNKEIIDILLNAGFDVNSPDKNGNTPLHRAAGMYNFGIMCQLIKANANLYASNNDRTTPLTPLDILRLTRETKYNKYKDRLITLYNKVQQKRLKKEDVYLDINTGFEFDNI